MSEYTPAKIEMLRHLFDEVDPEACPSMETLQRIQIAGDSLSNILNEIDADGVTNGEARELVGYLADGIEVANTLV